MAEKQNIIALDLDRCIYPDTNIASDIKSDFWNIKELEINLWKLSELIRTTDAKVFITSSWSLEWEMAPQNQIRLNTESNAWDLFYVTQVTGLVQQYLGGHIIGLSEGNRLEDVQKLDDGTNRIVAFDDWEFSKDVEERDDAGNLIGNVKFYHTLGSLTRNILWSAQKFLNGTDTGRKKTKDANGI